MKKTVTVALCLLLALTLLGCSSIELFGLEIPVPDFSQWKLFDFELPLPEIELPMPEISLGKTPLEEMALEHSEEFLDALQKGDWETVKDSLPLDALAGSFPMGDENLLSAAMESMSCQVKAVTEQADGSVLVEVEVETVDMFALLGSLPAAVDSPEAAREEMLRIMDTAPRKTFDATFTVNKNEAGDMEVDMDVSFANALSGGMYDILQDLMEGALGQ